MKILIYIIISYEILIPSYSFITCTELFFKNRGPKSKTKLSFLEKKKESNFSYFFFLRKKEKEIAPNKNTICKKADNQYLICHLDLFER